MSAVEDFVNEPLDLAELTIRVLKILPTCSQDTIQCILQHVPRKPNNFAFLSYMWGAVLTVI